MKKLFMGLSLFLGLFFLEIAQAQEIIAELDDITSTSVCDMNASSDGNIIIMGDIGIKKITPNGDLLWSYLPEEDGMYVYKGPLSFIERSNGNLLFPFTNSDDNTPVVAEFSQAGELLNQITVEELINESCPIAMIEMPDQSIIASMQTFLGSILVDGIQLVSINSDLTNADIITGGFYIKTTALAVLDADHFLAACYDGVIDIVSTIGEIMSTYPPLPCNTYVYKRMERINSNLIVAISDDYGYPEAEQTISYYDGNGEYWAHATFPGDFCWDMAADTVEERIYVSGENLAGKSTIWTFDYNGCNTSTFTLDELDIVGNGIAIVDDFVYVSGKSNDYQKTLVVKIAKDVVTATSEIENNSVSVTIYPNPATDKVFFEMNSEQFSKCTVVVRNLQGQVVERLLLENGAAVWQAKNSVRGIYLYSIETANSVIRSGKMVLH